MEMWLLVNIKLVIGIIAGLIVIVPLTAFIIVSFKNYDKWLKILRLLEIIWFIGVALAVVLIIYLYSIIWN